MRPSARRRPRHTEARLEVPVVLLVDLVDVHAHAGERRGCRVEDDELVVPLGRRDVPFVAQPHVQREVGSHPDVVLREERHGVLANVAQPVPERDAEGVGVSRQEGGDAREIELPRALREIVVEKPPVLPAEPHRMAIGHTRDGVVEDVQRILPSLRQSGRSAEVERAGDDDLRQSNRPVDAVPDPEVHRIERRRRVGAPVLRGLPESRFVQQPRSKGVRVVHRQGALPDAAPLAEPGDAGSLRSRLGPLDLLPAEEHQDAIAGTGRVPDIGRPRVLVHGCGSGADEPRRAVDVEIVRPGDQRKQPPNGGIGDRRPLRVAQHEAVHVEPLPLSKALVGREEKRAAAKDGTAERASELVALERVRVWRRELEEVPRVERVVPEELVRLAAEPIASRTRDQVDDRTRHVTVFRVERRVVDLEFLDAGDRRRKTDRTERQVVRRHAVDDVADGFLAIACGIEGQRAGPANRRRRKAGLRGRHRSRHERTEVDEVAAVERNLMNGLRRHHMAHRTRRQVEKRKLRPDDDGFGPGPDVQPEVADQRTADLERQRIDDFGSEALGSGGDCV